MEPTAREPLGEVSGTKLRRLTINLSKRSNLFKTVKWWSEKNVEHRLEDCTVSRAQAMGSGEACLVSRNDPMHDSVAYLYNNLPAETDILHEYFVPRDRIVPFLHEMKARGINVSFASDNTRDPFYAYGDMDMLEVFREATRIVHLDHSARPWARSPCRGSTITSIEPALPSVYRHEIPPSIDAIVMPLMGLQIGRAHV